MTYKYTIIDTGRLTMVEGKYFTVFIHNGVPSGFEHNTLGDEYGGGIWTDGQKVTDYDGIGGWLPDEVCRICNIFGYDTTECEEPNDES